MPVNLVRFEHRGTIRWGIPAGDGILPLPGTFTGTRDLVSAVAPDTLDTGADSTMPWADVRILSPVTRDQQVICQGKNYAAHALESGMHPEDKGYNMIFRKASSAIVAADSDLVRPAHVRLLDYEIELGLVLKRDIDGPVRVDEANLHEFVAGVTIVNDYSARDVQLPQMQFYKGKSYRTFAPVGPYLCLLGPDEMPYLRELELTLAVNDEVRQRDRTDRMIHSPAATLTELSGVQDLRAGDLIATGTPAGCAMRLPTGWRQKLALLLPEARRWELFRRSQADRPYLRPGDVVTSRIASRDGVVDLGEQRNRVVEGT